MMMLGYSLLLTLALVVASPWWLTRMLTTGRYREGLSQRLGRVPAALHEAVRGQRTVWLHAVSVGEVLAASRLIGELEAALNASALDAGARPWRIVISTTTRTGQHLAEERLGVDRVFYMPLDFAFAMRAYLRVLRPAALILMESELWPRLLHECRRAGVPVAVANARISDRSFRRAMKVRALWSRILRMPTLFLAQSEQDAQRLTTLLGTLPPTNPNRRHPEEQSDEGPPYSFMNAPTIVVTGNLKYDVKAPKKGRAAELVREVANGRPVIVAGSTVGDANDNEESWLTTAWGGSSRNELNALLLLAPRHPERFENVWKEDATEFPAVKMSELLVNKNTAPFGGFSAHSPSKADVVLLDTIGDLAAVYSAATIAFVGGSLVKRGGHNPLEPAQFGVPVVMGPSFENFRDIVSKMQSAAAIRIVQNGVELEEAFRELLTNPAAARTMGEHGREVFESQQGATARTVTAILGMLEARA